MSSLENGGRKDRLKYENRAENGSVFYIMTVSFVFLIFAEQLITFFSDFSVSSNVTAPILLFLIVLTTATVIIVVSALLAFGVT